MPNLIRANFDQVSWKSACVHTIIYFCKCSSKYTPNFIFFNMMIRKLGIVWFYLYSSRADWMMEKQADFAV